MRNYLGKNKNDYFVKIVFYALYSIIKIIIVLKM